MQTTGLVHSIDLIEKHPEDYTTKNRICKKCGGKLYEFNLVYGWQCENVVYRHGKVWVESPCDNTFLSGG